MKTLKIGALVTMAILALSTAAYAAKPENPGKPDKKRPIPATDVELVKKISLKGRPPWAGGGKGKKEETATGVLGESFSGDKYAVVVGISDYPGEANDLNYSDDDAQEMAKTLTDVYGFANTNLTLLTNLEATREAVLEAIEKIPSTAGEVVFFFSGHGMKGKAKDGDKEKIDEAIVAHDGNNLSPIWDGELKNVFSRFETSRIIFVFDSCLAGGMKKDLEGSERVVTMATTENGYAYESDLWENGEFSYYFVDQGMLQGKAHIDTHNYKQVTIEEAFDYTKANCSYDRPTVGDSFNDDLLL